MKDTGEKKGSDIPAAALTVYLTTCVGALLSVALFGCNFIARHENKLTKGDEGKT